MLMFPSLQVTGTGSMPTISTISTRLFPDILEAQHIAMVEAGVIMAETPVLSLVQLPEIGSCNSPFLKLRINLSLRDGSGNLGGEEEIGASSSAGEAGR